jgi:hypothetical protein
MAAVAYPANLPAPQPGSVAARQQQAQSELPGRPAARQRFTDQAGTTASFTWAYSPAHMAIWLAWFEGTLLQGQRWFAISLPGRGGNTVRVVRYLNPPQQQLLPGGDYIVTAQLELRGAAQAVATP